MSFSASSSWNSRHFSQWLEHCNGRTGTILRSVTHHVGCYKARQASNRPGNAQRVSSIFEMGESTTGVACALRAEDKEKPHLPLQAYGSFAFGFGLNN
jgi:hypothetical protein